MAASNIPTIYDLVFKEVSGGVPVPFMKATAWSETRYKADATPPPAANSSAIGLFQMLDRTRGDFNKATEKSYTREDMKDPRKSAEAGAWHMRQIAREYARVAPSVFGIKGQAGTFDWTNPRNVGLVSLGYTAGWSDVQGVAAVVRKMLEGGIAPDRITVDTVIQTGQKLWPKGTIYVDPKLQVVNPTTKKKEGPQWSDPVLAKHVNQIVTDYIAQSGGLTSSGQVTVEKSSGAGKILLLSAIVGGLGYGAYKLATR